MNLERSKSDPKGSEGDCDAGTSHDLQCREEEAHDLEVLPFGGTVVLRDEASSGVTVNGPLHMAGSMHVSHNVTCGSRTKIKANVVHATFTDPDDDCKRYARIKDQSVAEIHSEANVFAPTAIYQQALQLLEERGLLLVIGPKSSGKTSLGTALLRHFYNRDRIPLVLHKYDELRRYLGVDNRQVVFIDNLFGDEGFVQNEYKEWTKCIPTLRGYVRQGKCHAVVTVQSNILSDLESKFDRKQIFANFPIIDMETMPAFTDTEKTEILRRHMEEAGRQLLESDLQKVLVSDASRYLYPKFCQDYAQTTEPDLVSEDIFKVGVHPIQVLFDQLEAEPNTDPLMNTVDEGDIPGVLDLIRHIVARQVIREIDSLPAACKSGNVEDVQMLLPGETDINLKDVHQKTPLHYATSYGNIEVVKILLTEGAETDVTDKDGWAAIHMASSKGHASITRVLTEHKASVNESTSDGDTPLHLACVSQHHDTINVLLESGVDTDVKDSDGKTPLHIACDLGCVDIAESLIKSGASLDVRDAKDRTPLHTACKERNVRMAEILLKSGANAETKANFRRICFIPESTKEEDKEPDGFICVRNLHSVTPLHLASLMGLDQLVTVLLDAKADTEVEDGNKVRPLHYACKFNHQKVVCLLLSAGANVEAQATDLSTRPLHLACFEGHTEIAKCLIENGAQTEARGTNGDTPLHNACLKEHKETAIKLLDSGADIEATDNHGKRPLHYTRYFEGCNTAEMLLDRGADIEAKDLNGRSALHDVCWRGQTEATKMLIKHGADIETANESCARPLHHAAHEGNINIIKILIEHEVQISAKDCNGNTPVHYASMEDRSETVALLLKHGADIDETNMYGRCALHRACYKGNIDTVKILIEHGAQLEIEDSRGHTPFAYAFLKGHAEVTMMLLKAGSKIQCLDEDSNMIYDAFCDNFEASSITINHDCYLEAILTEDSEYISSENLVTDGPLDHKETPRPELQTSFETISDIEVTQIGQDSSLGELTLHAACRDNELNTICTLLASNRSIREEEDQTYRRPLHYAAYFGNRDSVQILIDFQARVETKDINGNTPLQFACWQGHKDAAGVLLHYGADINTTDKNNRNSLHLSCCTGQTEILEMLIQCGASLQAKDRLGNTPLHIACRAGHLQTAIFLIEHGADVEAEDRLGRRPLHRACYYGKTEVSSMLVKCGTQINAADNDGWTPLHYACSRDTPEIMFMLIDHGANIEATDNWGLKPLHVASRNNISSIVSMLVNYGANVNSKESLGDGNTALHTACKVGSEEMTTILLEAKADVKAEGENLSTPLHLACLCGHTSTAKVLIAHGAPLEFRRNTGATPLIDACWQGHWSTAVMLLECGADIEATDLDGYTALQHACSKGHVNTASMLLEKGAEVNAANKAGQTALFRACDQENLEMIRILLMKGASITQADVDGMTPFHAACRKDNQMAIQLMMSFKISSLPSKSEKSISFKLKRRKSLGQAKPEAMLAQSRPSQDEDSAGMALADYTNTDEVVSIQSALDKDSQSANSSTEERERHRNVAIFKATENLTSLTETGETDSPSEQHQEWVTQRDSSGEVVEEDGDLLVKQSTGGLPTESSTLEETESTQEVKQEKESVMDLMTIEDWSSERKCSLEAAHEGGETEVLQEQSNPYQNADISEQKGYNRDKETPLLKSEHFYSNYVDPPAEGKEGEQRRYENKVMPTQQVKGDVEKTDVPLTKDEQVREENREKLANQSVDNCVENSEPLPQSQPDSNLECVNKTKKKRKRVKCSVM